MFKVELQAKSLKELERLLAESLDEVRGGKPAAEPTPEAEAEVEPEAKPTPVTTKKRKAPAKKAQGTSPKAAELDYDKDVKPYLIQIVGSVMDGRDAVRELAQAYGKSTCANVDAKHYPEIIEKAKAILDNNSDE